MVADAHKVNATVADLEGLPSGTKGEIIDGVLYTQPRPRAAHQNAIGLMHDDIAGPFQRGRGGGAGDWWILVQPGIAAADSPEFSPDLAGWRRTRLRTLPENGRIDVVPDWICEVLSPSNRTYDLTVKRRFYARIGVPFLWFVDVEAKALWASALREGSWLELGVWAMDTSARIAPFDALELPLAEWCR